MTEKPTTAPTSPVPKNELYRFNSLEEANETIRDLCNEWAEDHTMLQEACIRAGYSKSEVEGDSYGVPDIQELTKMLATAPPKRTRFGRLLRLGELGLFAISLALLIPSDEISFPFWQLSILAYLTSTLCAWANQDQILSQCLLKTLVFSIFVVLLTLHS